MPFGVGLRSAVAHFAFRKSPSIFPYPGLLTRPLHPFEYSLGEGALRYSQNMEASLSPRYKSCGFLQHWTRLIEMFQPTFHLISTMARGSHGSRKKFNCLSCGQPAPHSVLYLSGSTLALETVGNLWSLTVFPFNKSGT
jgi:hypothetical protein